MSCRAFYTQDMESNKRLIISRIFNNYVVVIFLAFSCRLAFTQPTNTTSVVLDVDGNQIQSNTKYYIFPLPGGGQSGGGLALSIRDRRSPCPPNVVQENRQTSHGLSLKIFPAKEGKWQVVDEVISLSTDVNMVFMAATICVQRTVWRLGRADEITGRRYVRSDGVLGRPGAETVSNWFRIEEHGQGYKIVYCPSVCGGACRVECGEVGVYVESGRRWLGLGGQPLVLAFKKIL